MTAAMSSEMWAVTGSIIVALIGLIGNVIISVNNRAKTLSETKTELEKTVLQINAELDKHNAVQDERISELTREVRLHNNFAQRVPVLEAKVETLEKRN